MIILQYDINTINQYIYTTYIRPYIYIYSIYQEYSIPWSSFASESLEADAPPTSRLGLHLSPIRARLGSDQVTPMEGPERNDLWG